MKFEAYPEYYDSGVTSLGPIPLHWEVVPFRYLLQVGNGQVDPRLRPYSEMPLVAPNHIEPGTGRLLGTESAADQGAISGKYEVSAGDIIYSKIRPALRKVTVAKMDCLCSADMYALRPLGSRPAEFYFWALLSEYFSAIVIWESERVAMPKVNRETLAGISLVLPPLEEQTQIAAFLDHETAKIDTLIEKQEQLIALLQEKRQAVISHAVTKGLNPDAPMRDSGVEWLGEIPAHWEVVQCRRLLSSLEQGQSPLASADPPGEREPGVLKISAVKRGEFRPLEAKGLDRSQFEESYRVRKGDLLVTRGNTPDLVADSCVVLEEPEADLMISDLIYRLNVNEVASERYLCLWLLSTLGRLQIRNDARGSSMTMAKVAQGHIKGWLVCLPSMNEQMEIVDHVEKFNGQNVMIQGRCEAIIELLKERRSALISAAVTGKIDVRNWKPPAPQASPEGAEAV